MDFNQPSLAPLSPKKSKGTDDNLIPLINIIFLLLIFYMVAGQIQATHVQGLELAEMNNESVAQQAPMMLQITMDNELYLNGELYSPTELISAIQAQVKNNKTTINIHADFRLTAKQLDQTLSILRENEIQRIELISEQAL